MQSKLVFVRPSRPALLLPVVLSFAAASAKTEAAQEWLFDFGSFQTSAAETWININVDTGTMTVNQGQIFDLPMSNGGASAVDFIMISRFNNANVDGTTSFAGFPASATRDSLFGNTESWPVSGGISNVFPKFKLASLDLGLTYDFTFYASRMSVSDNRETLYTVTGLLGDSVALNAANNVSNTVTLSGMAPNALGEIEVALSPGPNNNNANHFTYLGIMKVTAVPEPASAIFLLAGVGMALSRRQRRTA
jgi:hypothetical protein